MGFRHSKYKTTKIVEPAPIIKDSLTLTTNKNKTFKAFVILSKDLKLTDSGKPYTEIDFQSNIQEAEHYLNRIKKRSPNSAVYSAYKDGIEKKIWVDNLGRVFGSKIEQAQGITTRIRADVVDTLAMEGIFFMQCNPTICNVYLPKQSSVDFTKYVFRRDKNLDTDLNSV